MDYLNAEGSFNCAPTADQQSTPAHFVNNSALDEWEPNSSEDDLYAGEDDQEKVAKRFKCASEFDGYFFPSSNEDERAPSTIPDRQSSVSFDDNEGFFDDDLRSGKVHNGIYCLYLCWEGGGKCKNRYQCSLIN